MAGVLDSARFQLFLRRGGGRVGQGRARDGARRPRRHDGAGASATAPINGIPVTQLIAGRQAGRDRRPHAQRRRRDRQADGHQRLTTRRRRRRSRWRPPTSRTRSACWPAPRTSTASTATRTCTSASRSCIGAGGVEKIVDDRADGRGEGDARQVGRGGARGDRSRQEALRTTDVKIHEYQAKEILKKSACPSPRGGRRSASTRPRRPRRR